MINRIFGGIKPESPETADSSCEGAVGRPGADRGQSDGGDAAL